MGREEFACFTLSISFGTVLLTESFSFFLEL